MFVANGMVDGVISNELEISEGPVIGNGREEVVNCIVINSKFTRIIRVYCHCETQPKEDRG